MYKKNEPVGHSGEAAEADERKAKVTAALFAVIGFVVGFAIVFGLNQWVMTWGVFFGGCAAGGVLAGIFYLFSAMGSTGDGAH